MFPLQVTDVIGRDHVRDRRALGQALVPHCILNITSVYSVNQINAKVARPY